MAPHRTLVRSVSEILLVVLLPLSSAQAQSSAIVGVFEDSSGVDCVVGPLTAGSVVSVYVVVVNSSSIRSVNIR
jgi:hypothetical protein